MREHQLTDKHVEPILAWEAMLRTVSRLLNIYDREMMQAIALPLTWFDVLIQLDIAPDKRLRMQELAEAVVLSRSGLTRLVDRMEEEGYLRREHSTTDRRSFYAVLSPSGTEMLKKAREVHHIGIEEHFTRHLTDDDVQALYRAVTKVRQHLR